VGVSRTLSDLSNQKRLHGAQADISIGRKVPKASSRSGVIGSRQFEQWVMPDSKGTPSGANECWDRFDLRSC
jgi:hypothetical protein